MTNKEFVGLEKRLLPNLPDFTIWKARLVMLPVYHTLRAVQFEPSGFSQKDFSVTMFFMPLCIPANNVHLTFGRRINRTQGWKSDQPHLETDLAEALKGNISFLSRLQTVVDVARALEKFAQPNELGLINPHSFEALSYMLVQCGRSTEALQVLEEALQRMDRTVPWQEEVASRMEIVRRSLTVDDREAMKLLGAWQAETVSELGLEELVELV